ncbi:hypothetical protein HYV21_00390 [Candidatus Microgenomates bacterium]|nr:hypothetical protein [Candidatus Microgenomates bacterium]
MALERNEESEEPKVPETEDGGIDLDDPFVKLFRRFMLESIARKQGETTRCPRCDVLLPLTQMTLFQKLNSDGTTELKRFCTLCECEF